jgi:hypothetical protein
MLDRFVAYTRSSDFAPQASMSVSDLRAAIKDIPADNRLIGSSEVGSV